MAFLSGFRHLVPLPSCMWPLTATPPPNGIIGAEDGDVIVLCQPPDLHSAHCPDLCHYAFYPGVAEFSSIKAKERAECRGDSEAVTVGLFT